MLGNLAKNYQQQDLFSMNQNSPVQIMEPKNLIRSEVSIISLMSQSNTPVSWVTIDGFQGLTLSQIDIQLAGGVILFKIKNILK